MLQKALTQQTFEKICKKWADIYSIGESGIQMSYPVTGVHFRIKQLLEDQRIQDKLYGKDKPLFLLIDLNEIENVTYKDVEILISKGLKSKKPNQKIQIFLTGLDNHLKNNNLDIIKKVGELIEKYNNISAILFTEINIYDAKLYEALTFKTFFIQNIIYQNLYTYEDSLQYFKYLEERFQYTYPKNKVEILAKEIGGHYLLFSEVGRIMKANPDFSIEQILSPTTLVNKGLLIFNLLCKTDKETIKEILSNKKISNVSEYLKNTKLVTEDGKLGLNYWYHIKTQICGSSKEASFINNALELILTPTERNAFEVFQTNKGIISREMIAQAIWQNEWEDKYSDWAIDQLVHKLRRKIKQTNLPHRIVTKKGEGFILLTK